MASTLSPRETRGRGRLEERERRGPGFSGVFFSCLWRWRVRAGIYNFPGPGGGMEGSSPSGLYYFLGLRKKGKCYGQSWNLVTRFMQFVLGEAICLFACCGVRFQRRRIYLHHCGMMKFTIQYKKEELVTFVDLVSFLSLNLIRL
jgi:hypothetical protein